jgi:hypothetical protein
MLDDFWLKVDMAGCNGLADRSSMPISDWLCPYRAIDEPALRDVLAWDEFLA